MGNGQWAIGAVCILDDGYPAQVDFAIEKFLDSSGREKFDLDASC